MGDLFDSWWKVLIIAIVVLVLFGSKKLPGAAKSLGQSMRILKKEVAKMHDDDEDEVAASGNTTTASAQAQPQLTAAAPVPSAAEQQQAQIDALQQQIRDMQRAATMDPVTTSKQDD